jgi:hypothetical protein
MDLDDKLKERLRAQLDHQERERAIGYTLETLHGVVAKVANRLLVLERWAMNHGFRPDPPEKPPLVLNDSDRIPALDAEGLGDHPRRRASDRAAAISMSAPGLHARFRGGAPTRFAMGFLLAAVVVAGVIGYALRPAVTMHAAGVEERAK